MSEWRPIETAPKDGQPILAVTPAGLAILSWRGERQYSEPHEIHEEGWFGAGEYIGMYETVFSCPAATIEGERYEAENQPYLWAPLPEPPEE